MEFLTKKLTNKEFRELEFDENDNAWYELINGELVQKQSPTVDHQNIVGNILMAMKSYARKNNLGRVYPAPLDVVLDDENAYQPDVLFIRKDRYHIIDDKEKIVIGAPDLIVEVLSKGTARHDKGTKRDIYEMYGVREYWLIDQKSKVVEIYGFEQQRFKLMQYQEETGTVTSSVLTGFQMELDEIFQTD